MFFRLVLVDLEGGCCYYLSLVTFRSSSGSVCGFLPLSLLTLSLENLDLTSHLIHHVESAWVTIPFLTRIFMHQDVYFLNPLFFARIIFPQSQMLPGVLVCDFWGVLWRQF